MPRPVHFEIHAQDPERGKAFYAQLFGWTFQHLPELDYWLIHTGEEDGGINGGMLKRKGPNPGGEDPVIGWICTMGVDDVDGSMARAQDLGGSIAMEKMDVPGYGWLGYCKDTEGNIFGMMQPKM
jgi:predicted enzyme related to lactoylglutathione lyase